MRITIKVLRLILLALTAYASDPAAAKPVLRQFGAVSYLETPRQLSAFFEGPSLGNIAVIDLGNSLSVRLIGKCTMTMRLNSYGQLSTKAKTQAELRLFMNKAISACRMQGTSETTKETRGVLGHAENFHDAVAYMETRARIVFGQSAQRCITRPARRWDDMPRCTRNPKLEPYYPPS